MRCCMDAAAAVVETPTPTPSLPLQSPASSALRSLNDIPSEMLGMALDYLPLADVLSCLRTQNRHLCQDAIGKARHLNVMKVEELDARYAKIFPSVQSINVLCLFTDYFFEKLMGSASFSEVRYFVNESAIHGRRAGRSIPTFLKSFDKLERVFLGGHCYGSRCVYKPRSCQGPKQILLRSLFFSLCLAFEESALSDELCPEGLRPSMICSEQCRVAGEQCPLCRRVADTFPANFLCQEESVAGPWCLSMSERLRRIESRPKPRPKLFQSLSGIHDPDNADAHAEAERWVSEMDAMAADFNLPADLSLLVPIEVIRGKHKGKRGSILKLTKLMVWIVFDEGRETTSIKAKNLKRVYRN